MLILWTIMIGIGLLNAPPLYKNRHYRELAAFTVMWATAGIYASLLIADVAIPNPTDIITFIFTRLFPSF